MPVHIFLMNEENFKICVRKGLTAIPSFMDRPNINDALLSRLALVRKGDLILFYITGVKELRGVYKALEKPFIDDTPVWESDKGQVYPYRLRFDNSEYQFPKGVSLSDIYDLRDQGLIWTFSLTRPNGAGNSMFSITDSEYEIIFDLFLKKNPIFAQPEQIREPYQYFKPGILSHLCLDDKMQPKYESTIMSLLHESLSNNKFNDMFGSYSDYVSYVPTSFNKEIDILLINISPLDKKKIIAYTIVEVKRTVFDPNGLSQLLQYEDWFLKKRVNGDFNMIRSVAIAKSFSPDVKNYLSLRKKYENKKVSLFKYKNTEKGIQLIKEDI